MRYLVDKEITLHINGRTHLYLTVSFLSIHEVEAIGRNGTADHSMVLKRVCMPAMNYETKLKGTVDNSMNYAVHKLLHISLHQIDSSLA